MKRAAFSAAKALYRTLPILLGVILLIGYISTVVPKTLYTSLLSGNSVLDPIVAALLGSILAGNPVTSYVLGGEFLSLGISLIAVTAFLTAWVTVGIVQLPAEILMLGKRFAITRNVLSFVFSILVAVTVVVVVGVVS